MTKSTSSDKDQASRYRPADGRRVRHPGGALLSAEGEELVLNTYWRRLLADGDIELVPVATSKTKGSASA